MPALPCIDPGLPLTLICVPADVVECPTKNTWGLSYDDGPSPDTPRLLQYLDDHDLTSTFFVVGSRAISRPEILQYEYLAGHQISVHTWEHGFLTTKTNEEIVASLGWTKQAMTTIVGFRTAPLSSQ